jgi:hypothetical protein
MIVSADLGAGEARWAAAAAAAAGLRFEAGRWTGDFTAAAAAAAGAGLVFFTARG